MAREKIVGGWERRNGGGRPSGGECGESGLRGDGIGGEAKEGGQDVEQSLIYGLIFPGVRSQLILRFNCFVTRRGPPPTEGSFDLIKRIRRMSPRSPAHKRTKSLRGGSQEGEKKPFFGFYVRSSPIRRGRPRDLAPSRLLCSDTYNPRSVRSWRLFARKICYISL